MRAEQKVGREGARRIGRGREFQRVGAAKEKDLVPEPDFRRGTVSRQVLEDLRERGGM